MYLIFHGEFDEKFVHWSIMFIDLSASHSTETFHLRLPSPDRYVTSHSPWYLEVLADVSYDHPFSPGRIHIVDITPLEVVTVQDVIRGAPVGRHNNQSWIAEILNQLGSLHLLDRKKMHQLLALQGRTPKELYMNKVDGMVIRNGKYFPELAQPHLHTMPYVGVDITRVADMPRRRDNRVWSRMETVYREGVVMRVLWDRLFHPVYKPRNHYG